MSESISYSHEKDGTLVVTVPKGTSVGRVLVQEEGTCIGSLYYPDHFADVSKMYINLPQDLQLTRNQLAIEELQLPWDKAQLSTEKTQLSTEKAQLSGKDKIFGHIRRWSAIDAIAKFVPYAICDESTESYTNGLTDAYNLICQLPSAQPERTCVNCGRTANNGGWYADGGTRCPIEEHYALPKDGYCHLWEKRNVTDDDYPERREE